MGIVVDGQWCDEELPAETDLSGAFKRADSRFRDWITADGSLQFKAEAGRYHLYVAYTCPWAHRALIFRTLKKLDNVITVAYALPGMRVQGWTFDNDPRFPECVPDTVNGFRYLHQAYTASDSHYTGKVTVPTLWDTKTRQIVNNESSDIIRMLNSEFRRIGADDFDFYPPSLRAEIDRINELTYANLVRFDVAYFSLFKCNRRRIADYPNLSNCMRELYRIPGVAATVMPRQYIEGYWSLRRLNPTGIIPKGTPVDYEAPHDRARLPA
jgi:putative glutathione S-transferase